MFRSTTIIRELQYPCQSYYYLNTVVRMLSVVVWQHIILFESVCARGASQVCVFLLVLWTTCGLALYTEWSTLDWCMSFTCHFLLLGNMLFSLFPFLILLRCVFQSSGHISWHCLQTRCDHFLPQSLQFILNITLFMLHFSQNVIK